MQVLCSMVRWRKRKWWLMNPWRCPGGWEVLFKSKLLECWKGWRGCRKQIRLVLLLLAHFFRSNPVDIRLYMDNDDDCDWRWRWLTTGVQYPTHKHQIVPKGKTSSACCSSTHASISTRAIRVLTLNEWKAPSPPPPAWPQYFFCLFEISTPWSPCNHFHLKEGRERYGEDYLFVSSLPTLTQDASNHQGDEEEEEEFCNLSMT